MSSLPLPLPPAQSILSPPALPAAATAQAGAREKGKQEKEEEEEKEDRSQTLRPGGTDAGTGAGAGAGAGSDMDMDTDTGSDESVALICSGGNSNLSGDGQRVGHSSVCSLGDLEHSLDRHSPKSEKIAGSLEGLPMPMLMPMSMPMDSFGDGKVKVVQETERTSERKKRSKREKGDKRGKRDKRGLKQNQPAMDQEPSDSQTARNIDQPQLHSHARKLSTRRVL